MSGLYRASITTAGFTASRVYELDDDDEQDERAVALIGAGLLVRQPDASIGGGAHLGAQAFPPEHEAERTDGGPYVDPDGSTNDYSRHGVPALPREFDVT